MSFIELTRKDKSGYYEPRARASLGVILTRGRTWSNLFEFPQYESSPWLSRVLLRSLLWAMRGLPTRQLASPCLLPLLF